MSKIEDFGHKLYEAVIHKPLDQLARLFGKHVRIMHTEEGDSVKIDTPLRYIGNNIQNIFSRQTKVEYVSEPIDVLHNIQDVDSPSANAVRKAALKELLRNNPQEIIENDLEPRTLKVAIDLLLRKQKASKDPYSSQIVTLIKKASNNTEDKKILYNCVKTLLNLTAYEDKPQPEATPGEPKNYKSLLSQYASKDELQTFDEFMALCNPKQDESMRRNLVDIALQHLVEPDQKEKFFKTLETLSRWQGTGTYTEEGVYIPPDEYLTSLLTEELGVDKNSLLYHTLHERFAARYKDKVVAMALAKQPEPKEDNREQVVEAVATHAQLTTELPRQPDPMLGNLFTPFRSQSDEIKTFEEFLTACGSNLEQPEKRELIDKALRHLLQLSRGGDSVAYAQKFFYDMAALARWNGDGVVIEEDDKEVFIPADKCLEALLTKGLAIDKESNLYSALFTAFSQKYKAPLESFIQKLLEEIPEFSDESLTNTHKTLITKALTQEIIRSQAFLELAKKYKNPATPPLLTEAENITFQKVYDFATLVVGGILA